MQVKQEEWDACATGCGEVNPFLLWKFLHCLEESGSAVRGPPIPYWQDLMTRAASVLQI